MSDEHRPTPFEVSAHDGEKSSLTESTLDDVEKKASNA